MSNKKPGRRDAERRAYVVTCVVLALVFLGFGGYAVQWYLNRARIEANSARYQAMYAPDDDAAATTMPAGTERAGAAAVPEAAIVVDPETAPTATETPTAIETQAVSTATTAPTAMPAEASVPDPTLEAMPMLTEAPKRAATLTLAPTPSATPTARPTPTPRPRATETAETTPASTAEPALTPEPSPTHISAPMATKTPASGPTQRPSPSPEAALSQNPVVSDEPVATANADTLVFALPTAPPVQASFEKLLGHNPDTVGYLEIGDVVSLPVVQRENDNEYYLDHTFDGEKRPEGTLFLDGVNRLIPEDDCLIVYGHNMKNGQMFGQLHRYSEAAFWARHPVIRFDTLYENRRYVPFAAFTASMTPGDRHYFDIRRFMFDAQGFERFAADMRKLSTVAAPVDVRYGDRLLLLVTCEYTNDQGRFILALRQLRVGENEAEIGAMMAAM